MPKIKTPIRVVLRGDHFGWPGLHTETCILAQHLGHSVGALAKAEAEAGVRTTPHQRAAIYALDKRHGNIEHVRYIARLAETLGREIRLEVPRRG